MGRARLYSEMSLPTITCANLDILVGPSYPADYQPFNQVWFYVGDVPWIRYNCDPELSSFVPRQPGYEAISGEEFNELWPLILLMFVTAFGISRVIKTFLR